MADRRVTGGVGCDDRCGCPVPCPGGTTCRCAARATEGGYSDFTHKRCSCGMHCSCNPCECGDSAGSATVGSRCTCGSGCSCGTCKSSGFV